MRPKAKERYSGMACILFRLESKETIRAKPFACHLTRNKTPTYFDENSLRMRLSEVSVTPKYEAMYFKGAA